MMLNNDTCGQIMSGADGGVQTGFVTVGRDTNVGLRLLRVFQTPFDEIQVARQPYHLLALNLAPLNVRWRTEGAWQRVETDEPAALFVPAGLVSSCSNEGTLDAVHLHVSPARLRALLPESADIMEGQPPGNLHGEWVRALRTSIMAACKGEDALDGLTSDVLLVGVGGVLLNAKKLFEPMAPRRGLATWQLDRVRARLADALDRDVGLDELAKLVGLTPTYLCTAFREATGLPPHQWQKRRRVERAKACLLESDAGIAQIARAVGYSNPSHFATVFKSVTGWSPRAWRQEHKK